MTTYEILWTLWTAVIAICVINFILAYRKYRSNIGRIHRDIHMDIYNGDIDAIWRDRNREQFK